MKKTVNPVPFLKNNIISIVLILLINCTVSSRGDDIQNVAEFNQFGGYFGWIDHLWNYWSGRIIIHSATIFACVIPNWLFILINSVMLFVMIDMIYRIITVGDRVRFKPEIMRLGITILFVLLVPLNVIKDAALWKSASTAYLWGFCCMLLAIYPAIKLFYGISVTRAEWIVAFIGAAFSANFELTGLIQIFFTVILTVYVYITHKDWRYDKRFAFIVLEEIAITVLSLSAPGNMSRMGFEVTNCFPEFSDFTFFDKLILGVVNGLQWSVRKLHVVMALLSLLMFIKIISIGASKLLRIISLLPIVYYFAGLTNSTTYSDNSSSISRAYTDFINVNVHGFVFTRLEAAFTILSLIAFIVVCIEVLLVSRKRGLIIPSFLFLGGGFCTCVAMGFSPTVYTSGPRTGFLFAVMLLVVLVYEINTILEGIATDDESKVNRVSAKGRS